MLHADTSATFHSIAKRLRRTDNLPPIATESSIPERSGTMSAGVKEFLETLKHTLDLKKTMCELDLTEDAARAMIDTIEKVFLKLPPFSKGGGGD